MCSVAKEVGGETVLLTFDPHPRQVLNPQAKAVPLLSTFKEKQQLLAAAGIDHLVVIPFTPAFAALSPLDYVEDLLVNILNVHTMIVGYDHRFGAKRGGDFSFLQKVAEKFSFEVIEIPPKDMDNVHVSSTKIRQALSEGLVEKANEFLGYRFGLEGTVVSGEGRGKSLGFPTANVDVADKSKLIPKEGVYAVSCMVNGQWQPAMMNIGTNPTFGPANKKTIEVHLLNSEENVYNCPIEIKFIRRLRDEEKFSSVGALIEQLKRDRMEVEKIFL